MSGQLADRIQDWGGSDSHPYTTPGEVATAAASSQIAEHANSSFVLALGDNFYSLYELCCSRIAILFAILVSAPCTPACTLVKLFLNTFTVV